MYMNKIKIITTLDIILHIEWRGKEKHYGIEGKVYWQTGILAVTDLYLLFLEMCVFAGICGGQEMDLNCSLGDCELPDVGAGDRLGPPRVCTPNHRVSSAALVQIFKLDFCVKNE